jgi:hypothetical protein
MHGSKRDREIVQKMHSTAAVKYGTKEKPQAVVVPFR